MKLRTLIVDDEAQARNTLRNLLAAVCPEVEIAGEAGGVGEALELLSQNKYDLLLLDVQMEDGTGFDLLDQVETPDFHLIFTTAYDAFAIKAFRYNAIDYLLKPVNPDELAEAIHKIQPHGVSDGARQKVSQLVRAATEKKFDRIVLENADELVFTETVDIIRMESYGNYTFVFLADGRRCLVSRNLKEFEEMLPMPDFFRLHQSHIANTKHVQKFLKEDGGYAVMKDGSKLPVSRRRKDAFLQVLAS